LRDLIVIGALAAALASVAGCAALAPDALPSAEAAVATATPALPPAPVLRLPPASLGRQLALQQRIVVRYRTPDGEASRELLTLLQADASHTRLAAIAGSQVLARLDWDGEALNITRAPWAPAELAPERILSDLQLALWPADAIAHALPAGWTLDASAESRVLRYGETPVVELAFPGDGATDLIHRRDGYALTIRPLQQSDIPR